MSDVYWDTMLYQYWINGSEQFTPKVEAVYRAMRKRGDRLCASHLTLAELLVLPKKQGQIDMIRELIELFSSKEILVLPFDATAAVAFAAIRARNNIKSPDAIHLACAASVGIDLFLTNDRAIQRLNIPGIKFIDGLDTSVLIK